jgi:hypothetical protein
VEPILIKDLWDPRELAVKAKPKRCKVGEIDAHRVIDQQQKGDDLPVFQMRSAFKVVRTLLFHTSHSAGQVFYFPLIITQAGPDFNRSRPVLLI